MTHYKDLAEIDEEFNNFMHRVEDINQIVKKLSSNDAKIQKIGSVEADRYLKCNESLKDDTIVVEDIKVQVKSDRTVINKKTLSKDTQKNENTMSQDAFMETVSKDAERRYQDKKIRQEKADTLKTRANKAFRRGEFVQALSLYEKAIEHIKDSPQLYLNRALAQINLKRYDYAIKDIETALQFNENSLKAHLLLAKCYYLTQKMDQFKEVVREVKERNQNRVHFINEYLEKITNGEI